MSSTTTPRRRQRASGDRSSLPTDPTTTDQEQKDEAEKKEYNEGTNFVAGGIEENPYFFALIVLAPFLTMLLSYLTSAEMATQHPGLATQPVTGMVAGCLADMGGCARGVLAAGLSVVRD
jgi:hypothetical protein